MGGGWVVGRPPGRSRDRARSKARPRSRPRRAGTTRPLPRLATSPRSATATGSSSGATGSSPARRTRRSTPRARSPSPRWGRPPPKRSTRQSEPRATAFDDGWSSISPSERAKYLFRIARILQERSREFAVLESINGGKPIRESRDVDLPLSAAHFFYYAGWADKLEYAFPNRKPTPDRRRRPDRPVELPAAHALLEDRARARGREHGRAQAGRDDAALRAPLR